MGTITFFNHDEDAVNEESTDNNFKEGATPEVIVYWKNLMSSNLVVDVGEKRN